MEALRAAASTKVHGRSTAPASGRSIERIVAAAGGVANGRKLARLDAAALEAKLASVRVQLRATRTKG